MENICNNNNIKEDYEFKQRQAYGFYIENEIREKIFGLEKNKNDTKIHDIPKQENKYNHYENISIKSTISNTVLCGDILRFYDYKFDNNIINTIIIVKYSCINNYNIISEIIEIDYSKELHTFLFGTVSREIIADFVNYVKNIPKNIVNCTDLTTYRNNCISMSKNIMKINGMNIVINTKIDSKSQRRVQCSISNIETLLRNMPQLIISRNYPNLENKNISIGNRIGYITIEKQSAKPCSNNKTKTQKPCNENQERNPMTNRCTKKCKNGEKRNEKFNCVKV
jgi:hypothetical protein